MKKYSNYIEDSLIIFQTSSKAKEKKYFKLQIEENIYSFKSYVYGRFVPERKDDFEWENDRIAYRMYGTELQKGGEISSGIDVWVKKTNKLIIDDWYLGANYHIDYEEGLDFYSVGKSRGCGGLAIFLNQQLYVSKNFVSWKILENGPIRVSFESNYAPWEFGDKSISEIKRISLDRGQNLNRIQSRFFTNSSIPLTIAIGVAKRNFSSNANQKFFDYCKAFSYWQPPDTINGNIGCGIILTFSNQIENKENEDHYLLIINQDSKQELVYYAGAGWSKSGNFNSLIHWEKYIQDFAIRLNNPIIVKFK